MKSLIRSYFRRNYASFSSIGFRYHKYQPAANNKLGNFHFKTSQSFCTNRVISEPTHLNQLNPEPNHDISICDLLSYLKTRFAEANIVSPAEEITSNSSVLQLLHRCSTRLPQFTDDQLLDLMDSLLILKSQRTDIKIQQTIKSLISDLDHACLIRSTDLNIPNLLPMMERFYKLRNNHSIFLHNAITRCTYKIHRQPLDILVRFVRIMNRRRYWRDNSRACKPYEIEHYLERNFEKLNVQQMDILIVALTQTDKSTVSFELKRKLFLYVLENLNTMNQLHLRHFLELFCIKESFAANMISLTPEFIRLLNTFNENFDTFTLDCVALVGKLSTKFLVYQPDFLEKLCRRFFAETSSFKRTIDYCVYTLTFFNYRSNDDPDVYFKILEIINANPLKASYKHTKRYYRLVSWLCNVGVYDYNTINEILDEKYLSKTFGNLGRFSLYPYPFVIDLSVEIECPDYAGNRLNLKLKRDLTRCHNWNWTAASTKTGKTSNKVKVCHTDQYQMTDDPHQHNCKKDQEELPYCHILGEMSSKMSTLFGEETTYVGSVLPHMPRPNLFFCLDNDKRLRNLAHLKENFVVDWNKLDFQFKWFAVTVLMRNTLLPDTVHVAPWGTEITKWRQLQKLNFKVVAVVQDEWIGMSEEHKIKLCTNLIG